MSSMLKLTGVLILIGTLMYRGSSQIIINSHPGTTTINYV